VLFELPAPESPTAGHSAAPRLGLAFCGRRHWYECLQWEPTVFPADFCRRLAVPRLLLTNAAGGINASYHPGEIVLIRDHLRLTFLNPLLGPHNPLYGPRFPDQSHVYDAAFRADLHAAAQSESIPLTEGVYAYSCGPTFETPAEVRAYGMLGADLVGMSTVPEAIVATACGIQVAALSLVTNMAAGLGGTELSHEEVVETARISTERMVRLLSAFLRSIGDGR
jgi:purine-nucleoside phosphorylase